MVTQAAGLFHGFDRFALRLAEDVDPDDDWLSVTIDVRFGSRVWSDEDTCLTRGEARDLAGWMDRVAEQPTAAHPPCTFREANLRFRIDEGKIVVTLELEFAPPEHDGSATPIDIPFPLEAGQARAFAKAIGAQLEAIAAGEEPEDDDPLLSAARGARARAPARWPR